MLWVGNLDARSSCGRAGSKTASGRNDKRRAPRMMMTAVQVKVAKVMPVASRTAMAGYAPTLLDGPALCRAAPGNGCMGT